MVDEVTTAPVQAASTEPAAPAAPAVDTPVDPASTTVSPETVAPIVDAPQAETPAEAPKTETLLAGDKVVEEKPAEVKKETKTEEKPAEVKTEDAPVEPPKYEFNLPEGVKVDDAKFGEFTKMLGEFETTAKVPHEELQKLGQQMVDRHIQEMQRYTQSLTEAWNKQKNDWKDSFLKDPEFANRTNTVVNAAIDVIDTYAGSKEQANEFRELMEKTGIGNHPAMIRLLSNIKLARPEPKQLAAPQIATPEKPNKIQKMYGKKTGG